MFPSLSSIYQPNVALSTNATSLSVDLILHNTSFAVSNVSTSSPRISTNTSQLHNGMLIIQSLISKTDSILIPKAHQTPRQRAANAKFASINTKKQGKPRAKTEAVQFPISKGWIFVLVFLVCGGALLEILRLFF